MALFNGGRNSFQLFGRNGEPFGHRKVVGNPDPCTRNDNCERLVDAAMNSRGDLVVIWQRWFSDAAGALRSEVLAQLFDRSAAPLGERFKVNESQPHAGTRPVAALSDDGTLTVVWSRLDKALVFRQFQADFPGRLEGQ